MNIDNVLYICDGGQIVCAAEEYNMAEERGFIQWYQVDPKIKSRSIQYLGSSKLPGAEVVNT